MKKSIGTAVAFVLLAASSVCSFAASDPAAEPSAQKFTVDGQSVSAEIYNIGGNNYFKLRDVAMLLKDTDARFSVDFDAESGNISAKSSGTYTPVGGELETGTDKSSTCTAGTQPLMIDGASVQVSAYNLGGNNFFKLRDLGDAFGFYVAYDSETNTASVDSSYYIRHTDLDSRGYNLKMSYEVPVFNSDAEGIQKINEYMQFLEDSFVRGEWDDIKEAVENNPPREGDDFSYLDTWTSEVRTYSPNIISIVQEYETYLGGQAGYGYRGFNFDTNTGEILYLDDVLDGTEGEIKEAIVEGLKGISYFEVSEGTENYDRAASEVRNMDIKDINFCMSDDGRVFALFSKYEITTGSAGAFEVEIKGFNVKNDYDWRGYRVNPAGEKFTGEWACGRASIEISPEDEGYKCMIRWGDSAFKTYEWLYSCDYIGESDCLYDSGRGVESAVVFENDGGIESEETFYTDGSARFYLNPEGRLIWDDLKENAGKDMEFEKLA